MGHEFRAKGINVMLGPVVGPMGRVLTNGRNWEGEVSSRPAIEQDLTSVSRSLAGSLPRWNART